MNTLIDHLRGHGDRPAVHTAETTLTYRALAGRVATAAAEFGSARKLIMLQTRNDITTLTYYLGALAGGHVVIPVPAGGDHVTGSEGDSVIAEVMPMDEAGPNTDRNRLPDR